MAVKNEGFPDLERYLEERGRHLVTYTEGATMYHIPYYSFVRLAKEAGANLPLRRTTVIDVDIIEEYLKENPFCVKCYEEGHITMATVVDHIKPHRGDKKLFWDRGNWQPLCEHHHNVKTMTEDRYVEYRF